MTNLDTLTQEELAAFLTANPPELAEKLFPTSEKNSGMEATRALQRYALRRTWLLNSFSLAEKAEEHRTRMEQIYAGLPDFAKWRTE